MAVPAERLATYQDLIDLPDHVVGEILYGALHVSPRPASPHALASSSLGADVLTTFSRGRGGPGGWWILDEPELHLSEHALVPDLAGWRRERMPTLPSTAAFTLAPDWVCEVVSPGSSYRDRALKLPIYAAHEVPWAWLVDPIARTVEILRREGARWQVEQVVGKKQVARMPPFEAVEFELEGWWLPEDAASLDTTPRPT